MDTRVSVLAWLLLVVTLARSQRYEGDACVLEDGGRGVCTLYQSCTWAAQSLKPRGLRPKVCSFSGFQPIICCKRSQETTTRRTNDVAITHRFDNQTATTPSTKPTTAARPQSGGEKAKKMCREYSRYVVRQMVSPVLTLHPPKYNFSNCPIVAQTLIVNGVKAEEKEFPHSAALGYGERNNILWLCGGSLISVRFILTAAHCISARGSQVRWARLGDINLENVNDEPNAETVAVAERIIHFGYKPPARYNDIALLKLVRDVKPTIYLRPACLYTEPGNPPNLPNATAIGWGKTNFDNDDTSPDLMKVDLTLQPESKCDRAFRKDIRDNIKLKAEGITPDTMICAGVPQEAKDTCNGDSGSPLQIRLKDPFCMMSITGLTSFGSAGCGLGSPAVYTRVSYYVPWIESIVWP